MITPSTPSSSPSRLSRSRLSSPRKSPLNTPTSSTNNNKRIKTALILKYLFLSILILLVCILLRINLQLLQRLDNSTIVSKNDNAAIRTKEAGGGNNSNNNNNNNNHHQLRATSMQVQTEENDQQQQQILQNRLDTLRKEVATMKKKVDELKQRMVHIRNIQRSSSANAILGTAAAGNDVRSSSNTKTTTSNKQLKRHTCTPNQESIQSTRLQKRFSEWWSHSACPDQVWMDHIVTLLEEATSLTTTSSSTSQQQPPPFVVLDIGCNKGYTSADFLDALSPGTNMNPHTLVTAIRTIAKEDNTKFDRDGGVCNDSKKALNVDRTTVRDVEVHCFEPSPATYGMLIRAHEKLMPKETNSNGSGGAKWFIHNKGLHKVNGEMKWHSACAHAVGDELCTIVEEGTADAITVPVVTVDTFLQETYPSSSELPLVHMLKIDAEGLDPAVLEGSMNVLTSNRAIMVMFEFNPGLSEKGDHPHGMWGRKGNPHVTLIEVTNWLDGIGYDCYLDTHLPEESEKKKGVLDAPGLYRITGDCLSKEPNVRGWANVVCASRKYGNVAARLLELATFVQT
mmetsp:Transcript_11164/g.18413  ORF Transcript_11164/g.18413 Transcript_11164/m.18413 type:complete len:568 (+) Transcript_11164:143-1846(+)